MLLTAGLGRAQFPASSQFPAEDPNPEFGFAVGSMRDASDSPVSVRREPEPIGGPVSADELRHPLSPKAQKMLEKAQRDSHAGRHALAIEELQRALAEPSASPYAHSFLGTEYLRTGRLRQGIEELEQAVLLLPHSAENHSNLGYALCLAGQNARPELEARRALALNPTAPERRFVLGAVLLRRGGNATEAVGPPH